MAIRLLLVDSSYSYPPIERQSSPLGFGYIASSLRREFGSKLDFKVIDKDLAGAIKSFQPDIVGITSVSKNYGVAKENARTAKQANLPVIIGGIHISFMPQTFTRDMDVGVVGEGERTIIDVVSSFIANKGFDKSELSQIKGIIYWDGDEVVDTKPRALIRILDSIPYPARDLLAIKRQTSMLSSRGCPYHCAFCSTARHTGNQVRYASAEYVADEIELIYKSYGVEYITIYDDLFAIKPDRVAEIVDLLGAKGVLGKLEFAINTRTDFVTDELATVFKQMHVHAVGLGVESGCQETLDYLKSGGITVEDNANAIRILKRHHIIPFCSFIVGSPYESKEAMMETVKFVKDNGVNFYEFCVLTPFPGTPVWEYAKSRGLVGDDMDWRKLDFYTSSNPVIVSEKMSRGEITEICTRMMEKRRKFQKRRQKQVLVRHPYKYILKPILKDFWRKYVANHLTR